MGNAITIKQSNIDTVRRALYSCRISTVKDLAQKTDISPATVGSILNILVETGEVQTGDMVSSTGGRPSQSYIFNAEYAYILALSARTNKDKDVIHASVTNLLGQVVWEVTHDYKCIHILGFESVIDICLKKYPTIKILAFSLPGVERDGVIVANDYKELEGLHFANNLKERYGLPVIIENDINAAVAGYGRTLGTFPAIVGIYFPRRYPPGAGLLINGRVFKGTSGYAGEINLMPLNIDWLTVNYCNKKEIAPAISKLICAITSVIDPHRIILYGDFFSDELQKEINMSVSKQVVRNIIPSIIYRAELEADITSGLILQALSLYESEAKA
ncbi:ROK family transcriptional regulator [Anaerocolumna sp. MB42-C2]|uniref:ROK family transcriptional regulator n=1 Tax=Anaerocolumna sp. MB42-C2 TaxID=3070997 RepID=UPI0027DFC3D8|nr:ROK family protein [Anaerocolumna sp. MB42-C2]WMJ86830.1 ROK family protein [Anaerocolumna sp. MB42-C2]